MRTKHRRHTGQVLDNLNPKVLFRSQRRGWYPGLHPATPPRGSGPICAGSASLPADRPNKSRAPHPAMQVRPPTQDRSIPASGQSCFQLESRDRRQRPSGHLLSAICPCRPDRQGSNTDQRKRASRRVRLLAPKLDPLRRVTSFVNLLLGSPQAHLIEDKGPDGLAGISNIPLVEIRKIKVGTDAQNHVRNLGLPGALVVESGDIVTVFSHLVFDFTNSDWVEISAQSWIVSEIAES